MKHSLIKSCGVFFGAILLSPLLPVTFAHGADLFVGAGGSDFSASDGKSLTKSNSCGDEATPCGSITHATALAKSGDTIRLGAGTFSKDEAFPIYVRAGVTLQGAGDGLTIIEGDGVDTLVFLQTGKNETNATSRVIGVKIRGNRDGAGLTIGGGQIRGAKKGVKNSLIKTGDGASAANFYYSNYAIYYSVDGSIKYATLTGNSVGLFVTAGYYLYGYGYCVCLQMSVDGGSDSINPLAAYYYYGGSPAVSVNVVAGNNRITNNNAGVVVLAYPGTRTSSGIITTTVPYNQWNWYYTYYPAIANVKLNDNIITNNNYGVYATEFIGVYYTPYSSYYYGRSTLSVANVFAGPAGADTGRNTFNNTNNIIDQSTGNTIVTTNNWWPTWETYGSPNSDPMSCADVTVAASGGAVTVSAADTSTFFVDRVGAVQTRLTLDIAGTAATVNSVSASGSSFSATVPAMSMGTYTATVTNAGGQSCTFNMTYVSPITISIAVTDGRGGRTTKTLTLTPQ